MQRLGFTATDDIQALAPGLIMSRVAGDEVTSLPAIRGVSQNDFAPHEETAIATYVDGSYISLVRALTTDMYDMDRVEVLRGPQGTLFGRNANGGLIQYITRKPSDTFDADVNVTVGSFNQERVEAAVGGPLADSWSARIAIDQNYNSGITENIIGPDIGQTKFGGSRAQLRYDSGPLDVLAAFSWARDFSPTAGNYHHQSSYPDTQGLGVNLSPTQNYWGTCDGCDILGYTDTYGDHKGAYNTIGYFDRTIVTAGLTSTVKGEHLTFTSLTNFLHIDYGYGQDGDASPNSLENYYETQTAHQLSQEFRLNGDSSLTRWVAGLYYMSVDARSTSLVDSPVFNGTPYAYGVSTAFPTTTQSYSAFGQMDVDLRRDLYLTIGARDTYDRKTIDFTLDDVITGGPPVFVYDGSQSENAVSGKLQLNYHPDENLLVYGGVTRGTKSGGFNAPFGAPLSPAQMPFQGEVLTDTEAGVKVTTAQLRIAASIFHYNYQNYQAFDYRNFTTIVTNKPAHMSGADLDMTMTPAKGLEISVGGSLLDATVQDVGLPSGAIIDSRPPQAPRYTANALVLKTWQIGRMNFSAQMDFRYVASYYGGVTDAPAIDVPPSGVLGARLGLASSDGRWEVAVLGKNLLNRDVMIDAFDNSGYGFTEQVFAPPRWISGQISYRWR